MAGRRPVIVCAAANPSIDKLFTVDAIELGEVHRPRDFLQLAGGKGINVARAVAALGGSVHLVTALGGHTGRWLAEELEREGLAASIVSAPGETRSSLSVADRSTGLLTDFYEHPAPLDSTAWEDFLQALEEVAGAASWMAISGSLPDGIPEAGYRDAIEVARAHDVKVAVDTSGRALAPALADGPDIVKVNAEEAGELLGRHVTGSGEALAAARTLYELTGGGERLAIVTIGAAGAVMAGPEEALWKGRVDARGPFPVGSGDSFLAALLLSLAGGETADGALAMALGAGTANAQVPGPGRLDPKRARSLGRSATVERA